MTSDRREGKMNYDLLRLLQKISEAGVDIGIQGGVAFLECRCDRMSAMNKLADEFEAHKAAIVDLFGPGDGIIEAGISAFYERTREAFFIVGLGLESATQ